jgi:predicted dehydrogenase
MDKQYKIGIIGAGKITDKHEKAISRRDDVILAAVADIVEKKAKDIADKHGCNYYTSYNKMLEQEDLDIAIITLPHFLHKEASIDCAKKGCHILLEKPMALDEEECNQIIDVCNENNVKLLIGHVQSYQAANIKAREIVEEGKLGQLLMIVNERYVDYFSDSRPDWFLDPETSGGGITMNLGAHSLEIVKYLSGAQIKSIKADVGYHARGVEVEGNSMIFASLDNGVKATVVLNGYKSIPGQTTKLFFTDGMLEVCYWPQKVTMKTRDDEIKEIELEAKDLLSQQLEQFIDSIKNDKKPVITGEYGRTIIKAIKAVYKSSQQEKEIFL